MSFETYLKENGYQEKAIDCVCPHCVTVAEFAATHPNGKYVLICQDAAVVIVNGIYVDFGDSGDEVVIYYYQEAA